MDDLAKMAAFQAMDRGHVGNRSTQGAVLGQINAPQPAELRNALTALLHWCDEQGHSLHDAIPEAQRVFSDNCLQWLADEGKIILGEDGRYRTPANHRRANLRLVSPDASDED